MLHKILKYGTVFVVVLCLAITPILTASADSNTFTFKYSQPACGENFGYVEVLTSTPSGLVPYLFLYNVYRTNFDSELDTDIHFEVNLFSSNSLVFTCSTNYSFYLTRISSDYQLNTYPSINHRFNYTSSTSSIVGVHVYGPAHLISGGSTAFNFIYSGEIDSDRFFEYLRLLYINTANSSTSLDELVNLIEYIDRENSQYMGDFSYSLKQILSVLSNLDIDSLVYLLEALNTNSSVSTETLANIETLLENYIEDTPSYLYDIWELVDNIDTVSSIYLPFLEHLDDNTTDLLTLMEEYVSLQEEIITQPPSSSSDLSESIQNNPPREDGKDIVGELDSAQNEALGGKSPEDVKEEIEDTLDSDKLKEEISEEEEIEFEDIELEDITIVNQNVFNVVFDAFGGKWASYVVLSLGLAFACFVIGRRY